MSLQKKAITGDLTVSSFRKNTYKHPLIFQTLKMIFCRLLPCQFNTHPKSQEFTRIQDFKFC